jgi:hypothetical protein
LRFDTIGEAWRWLGQQRGPWAAAILALVLIYAAVFCAANLVFTGTLMGPPYGPGLSPLTGGQIMGIIASNLIQWIAYSALSGGAYYMGIKHIRGEQVAVNDLFSKLHLAPRIMFASFLMGLAMMAGFILCFIPGLIVMGLLMLTVPLIVDRDMGAVEALGESWNALKGDWLIAPIYLIVLAIVASIGVLACGVGVIFTYPLFFLGIAGVYRDFFLGGWDPNPLEPLRDPPA